MYPIRVNTHLFITAVTTACLSFSLPSYSQTTCGSPAIAAAACSGGNGAASGGTNINTGNTYWFSGGPTTFSSLNLSGGTLRICGNLTVTSMTINGGNLIIEHGGILNISGSFNVSGLTIINRGTLTITGGLTLQGTVSTIWNDLTTSYLTITGSLTINNGSSIINRGLFTINGSLTLQGSGNKVCLQDNSIFTVSTLVNNVTNSLTYAGSGAKACLSVSGSASLNNALTASSNINVCKSSSGTSGNWGSATVISSCSSCGVILPLTVSDLTATSQGGGIMLRWTTHGAIHDGDLFYVERSTDGTRFDVITTVKARDDQFIYTAMDNTITAPQQYYRIRTTSIYSPITIVSTDITDGRAFTIYPNPIKTNSTLYIKLDQNAAANIPHLLLLDAAGRTIRINNDPQTNSNQLLRWDLQGLRPGIYFLKIIRPGSKDLNATLTVLDGN
jgi:hypothetical protein